MSDALPIDIGALERWGSLLLRPTLHIIYAGPRITEEVAIWYEYQDSGGYFGTATTASFFVPSKRQGTARYIRAWVHNLFGFPAHRCQVFVDRIWHEGELIDSERSALHWTDKDNCFQLDFIRKGYANGHYVDICATDSVINQFYLVSEKSKKGYHYYKKSGNYKIDMTAEASKPCSFSRFSLTVDFDATNWKNLKVICADEGKKLFRWI